MDEVNYTEKAWQRGTRERNEKHQGEAIYYHKNENHKNMLEASEDIIRGHHQRASSEDSTIRGF